MAAVYGIDDLPPAVRERLKRDFPFYAENALKIRGLTGSLQPLRLNKAQMNLHRAVVRQMRTRGYVRIIALKARQQGISTYITGRLTSRTTQSVGYKTLIMAHLSGASQNLFDMTARYIQHAPGLIMPTITAHNRQQLRFGGLDSMFTVATARNKDSGRSETLQATHLSEVAFFPWPEDIAKGVMAAIHDVPGTESYLESTADGLDTWFHNLWKEGVAGKHDYECVFSPWFWTDHYRKAVDADFEPTPEELELVEEYGLDFSQLNFRRQYIAKWGISVWRQEMPATPQEAFEGAILKGRVYPDFSMARNVAPVAYNPAEHVYIGMDFNVSPMSATLCHFRGKQVQQFAEVTLFDSNTQGMVDEIKARFPKSAGKITVFPDPSGNARKTSAEAGKTDFVILRSAGFQVIAPTSHDPVRDRINAVNRAIKGPNSQISYVVDPSCGETIKCFSRVRYVEGSSNQVNKREGLDHLPDAGGYLIMQLLPIQTNRVQHIQVKGA